MKIKLIDFGGNAPVRAHYNDAGADVFISVGTTIDPGSIKKVPLGFGLELPDGFVAFVLPRSGMTSNRGLTAEVVPIDSGYTGEVHAILFNASDSVQVLPRGTKVAQLVVVPTVLAEYTYEKLNDRGNKGFGSTGDTK